jgi:hypothetical protein
MVFAPEVMNRHLVDPLLFQNSERLRSASASMDEPGLALLGVLSGLLGAVTIGWSIQMAWIAYKPFSNGEPWAWNAMVVSLSAWAAVEFYFKWADGIRGLGLFAHFGLLIALAIPRLATCRYFHPAAKMGGYP